MTHDNSMAELLAGKMPERYWRTWNSYLVAFGQMRCTPRRPRCEGCPLAAWCARVLD